MAEALHHRGPDDSGVWTSPQSGIALGHRRLSIVDLSQAGHQPMVSACERFVIVLNGEIYNFDDLRRELDLAGTATSWRGHSDTEVLLAAVVAWGLEAAVKRTIGMFAFALWDRAEQRLFLVRDRMGEKPLYYGWTGQEFLFGSELKALRAHPNFNASIDRGALTLYLRHGCIPAPYTIYTGIRKLEPGTIAELGVRQAATREQPAIHAYWSLGAEAGSDTEVSRFSDEGQARVELESLLRNAVKRQMVADVPLGAFLSGGVDSSAIVALMQVQSKAPVKTFTIGFDEAEFNEAGYARAIARHLGTDHHELIVTPREAMAVIPDLPKLYDEPFSDSSQIPTFLLSKLARSRVTVSLSGDGGDELFGGYAHYLRGASLWRRIGKVPFGLRATMSRALMSLSPSTWNRVFSRARSIFPLKTQERLTSRKIQRLAELMMSRSPDDVHLWLVSLWPKPGELVIGGMEPLTVLTDPSRRNARPNVIENMMFRDTISYLPDDILVKVDRATMGVGLESRMPLLDHRVVQLAWQLPASMKIREGQGKWLLRQILHRYVPKELVERPKMGFGVPIGLWLRGPLRAWAESHLDENRLREEGFFDPRPIRQMWEEHLSGAQNWQHHLWTILTFEAWLGSSRGHSAPPFEVPLPPGS